MSSIVLLSSLAVLALALPQGTPVQPTTVSGSAVPTGGAAPAAGHTNDFPALIPINGSNPDLPFRIRAKSLNARLEGLQFSAAEGYFWLGRADAANNTLLQINDGKAFMYTAAPGGQRAFVGKDGALSYTAAHTGGAIPEGGSGESFRLKGSLRSQEFAFATRRDSPDVNNGGLIDDSPIFLSPWLACPIGQQAGAGATENKRDVIDPDCQPYETCADGHVNQPDAVTVPPAGFVPPTGNGTSDPLQPVAGDGADIGPYKIYASKISVAGPENPPNPGCLELGSEIRFVGTVNQPAPQSMEYFK